MTRSSQHVQQQCDIFLSTATTRGATSWVTATQRGSVLPLPVPHPLEGRQGEAPLGAAWLQLTARFDERLQHHGIPQPCRALWSRPTELSPTAATPHTLQPPSPCSVDGDGERSRAGPSSSSSARLHPDLPAAGADTALSGVVFQRPEVRSACSAGWAAASLLVLQLCLPLHCSLTKISVTAQALLPELRTRHYLLRFFFSLFFFFLSPFFPLNEIPASS